MENNKVEELIKTRFNEVYSKQMKTTKWIIFFLFGCIGLLFLICGIICLALNITDTDGFPIGTFFTVFGIVIFLFAVIFFVTISKKCNYEKFIEQSKKQGVKNLILLSATIDVQTEQINELKERIEYLESKL